MDEFYVGLVCNIWMFNIVVWYYGERCGRCYGYVVVVIMRWIIWLLELIVVGVGVGKGWVDWGVGGVGNGRSFVEGRWYGVIVELI